MAGRLSPSGEPSEFPLSGQRTSEPLGTEDGPARAAQVDAALAAGDVRAAVGVLLRLDVQATTDAERETVRAAVARLGAYAADAPVDRAAEVGPFIDLLLEPRASARTDKRFSDADDVRDRLDTLGVEVRDTASGAEWELRP